MIPYPYNMVDMGGIDLAEANGTVVEGLYAKIVEAVNACGDVVLYNWKFAGIDIAPQHTSILLGDPIIINGVVQVTEQDLVTVPGINPEPPEPPTPPVLVPLSVIENGQYLPLDYEADGFSEVSVEVPIPSAGKYQEVEPDFFGLATAYQANTGGFHANEYKNQCLLIARISSGDNYVVFLPEIYATRYRVGLWPGKSFSDFQPYLDSPGSSGEIYSGGTLLTPNSDPGSGSDLFRVRYFFEGVDGEIIIGTSNDARLIKPILLKIQEE